MSIASLSINDFRNLSDVTLSPALSGLNVICGKNGSGKTSLLEAIHFLSVGRSFRSSLAARLIRHDATKFALHAQVLSDNQQRLGVGIERSIAGVTRMRVAEKEAASITELAQWLPVRVINTQSHQLLESGPAVRRKYLDWGLFYQSNEFLPIWRNFERALRQRNTILQNKCSRAELEVWTKALIKHAEALTALRQEYVQALTPVLRDLVDTLFVTGAATDPRVSSGLGGHLVVTYHPGWRPEQQYASALADAYPQECRYGLTQCGPHRADLDLCIGGVSVKHFLSRGQQKLLICAMILAQGMLLAKNADKRLIYLIDDLPSELDLQSRKKLISLFSKQQTQVFITAIEKETICASISENFDQNMALFHVEHGQVTQTT